MSIPGYRVTPNGKVYSTDHNWRGYGEREMRQHPNGCGYPSVRLTIDGRRKRWTVHGLVARCFLPPQPSPSHQIRHLDGDKSNNAADNLAWGTAAENAEDRARHGRTYKGERHHWFKGAAIAKATGAGA